MAKVFDGPDEVPVPKFDFRNIAKYREDEKKYTADLSKYCIDRFKRCPNPDEANKEELIGKVIDFPVADGKALYMVASIKPLQLIHMPLGDAWHYRDIGKYKAKDVIAKIKQGEALAKLFS